MQSNTVSDSVNLRPALASDLKEIVEIENQSYPDAWPEECFLPYFEESGSAAMVAQLEGRVVGFILFESQYRRLHIADVAVSPTARRRGIARLLITHLIDRMPEFHRRRLTLEVRKSNTGAIRLYESLGFKTVRTKRKYYEDGEDALYMACQLPS